MRVLFPEQVQDMLGHLGLSSRMLIFELAFPEKPGASLLINQVDGGPNVLLPPIPVLVI